MGHIHTNPDHLRQSGGKLSEFGQKVTQGGQQLETAGQDLVAHASGDQSGIGAVVAKAMGKGVEITGSVFKEGGRVAEKAGDNLGTTGDLHEEADSKAAGLLGKLHPEANTPESGHSGGVRPPSEVGTGTGDGRSFARDHIGDDHRGAAVSEDHRTTTEDPVDLATGEVLLTQTDVQLPGVLPLILRRTHLSSCRVGRWFGASWASTLDQRVEVDDQGVVFVAEDGSLLLYPTPGQDPVLPAEGARWPLRRTESGYAVDKPEAGESLHFGADGLLQAITDRPGHRIEVDYDPAGAPTEVRHSGGYRVLVDTADGRITAFSVADIRVAGFGYQDGRLTEVVNGTGQPLRLSYDAEGRLTQWTDRNGGWYRYRYDAAGRCTLAEGRDGLLTSALDYDADNRVTTATDALGQPTRYHFNEARQIVRTVDPLGGEIATEWDRYDRLLSHTDQLGRTTRYEYTEAGDLARLTRADGSQLVVQHDDRFRLPTTVVDPDGAVWRREYDDVGNLVSVTDPAGSTTRFGYDGAHHLASMTDALGAVTTLECDPAGLTAALTDPLGATTRNERDAFGRIVATTDPLGGVTRLEWSTDGWLTARTTPEGSTERWRHDAEGNAVEHVDPLGGVTTTEFGGFDVPVARTDQLGRRTVFGYDGQLRLATLTNPAGLVWQYQYDAVGNLVAETDFNGRVRRYQRDAAGQISATANGIGQVTTFTRDVLGRVLERRSDDGVSTFAYDAGDRLVRAANQDTDLVLTRDVLGRIVAESCNGMVLSCGFDPLGRKTSRNTPGGVVSRWRYDAAGQPIALDTAGGALAFGYDAAGRETSRRFGAAGLTLTWDGDNRLRTQAVTTPGPAGRQRLVQRRAYTYRADDSVTSIVDQLAGITEFDLDPAGKVTAAVSPTLREQYGYDGSGNVTGPGRTFAGTLLRTAGSVRVEHDGDGRVVARHSRTLSGQQRTWRYLWSCENRLLAVTTPDLITWRYVYDALGRRVAKLRLNPDNSVAEQTWFTWDGTTLAEQRHSSGHLTSWDYRPSSHTPLTQVEGGQQEIDRRFYAIVTDLVGTATELVDSSGNLAWRQSTTLWGVQLAPHNQPAYCPLRFPGQYHDFETGLNYNHHRYYDPAGAGYLVSDPLGLEPAPNPYGYVPNPVRYADPMGLAPYKLNLGSGNNPMPGAINVDQKPGPGVDVVADASHLPFRDGAFQEVHAINPYGFQPVSAETARVMAPGGLLYVTGSPKNGFIRPPADLESLGFEHVSTGPMIDQHRFGTQALSDGTPLPTTANHRTHIYRKK